LVRRGDRHFFFTRAQDKNPPYRQLPEAPASYSAGSVASRMLDGLGFRFYWATEGCVQKIWRSNQVKKPDSRETMEHIYSMSTMIVNATRGIVHAEPDLTVPFDELRRRTLENFKARVANTREFRPDVKRISGQV